MKPFNHLKNPKTLGILVFAEALFIFGLLVYISTLRNTTTTQAQNGNGNSQLISQEVGLCNKLAPPDRPSCVRIVGAKIANLFSSPEEQIKECLKTRPFLVRYCQEGLRLLSPTP